MATPPRATPKYAYQREVDAAKARERKRSDRAVAREREKTQEMTKANERAKKAAAQARADHSLALSVAKQSEKIAIQREAVAKAHAEAMREVNAALRAEIKTANVVNKTVVDTMVEIVRVKGDFRIACELMSIRYPVFQQWMALGERENAEPIYQYLRQKLGIARAEYGSAMIDNMHLLTVDRMDDIVDEDGIVVGQKVGRKASDKVTTFMAEKLFPETFGPRVATPLEDGAKIEEDFMHWPAEKLQARQAIQAQLDALEKEMSSKKIVALQSVGRGIVDTEGENVVDSPSEE